MRGYPGAEPPVRRGRLFSVAEDARIAQRTVSRNQGELFAFFRRLHPSQKHYCGETVPGSPVLPLPHGVSAALHACGNRSVESIEILLALCLLLLVSLRLVLTRPPTASHGARGCTDSRAGSRVTSNRANCSAAQGSPRSATYPVTTTHCTSRALRYGRCRQCNGIDTGRLRRPGATLRFILLLLLGSLALCGINDRARKRRG